VAAQQQANQQGRLTPGTNHHMIANNNHHNSATTVTQVP
jgi:hypothetical protein